MTDYMYNLYDEEAEIEEVKDKTVIRYEGYEKVFADYDKAIKYLESLGYRF